MTVGPITGKEESFFFFKLCFMILVVVSMSEFCFQLCIMIGKQKWTGHS